MTYIAKSINSILYCQEYKQHFILSFQMFTIYTLATHGAKSGASNGNIIYCCLL